jgi:predicted  nucleic acid-binding Zn-ribbon protein
LVRSIIFPKFADMQSDEKTISALTAQAHNAEADKRTLQKKLAASERRVQDLEKRLIEQQAASDEKVRELTDKLSQEMSKVSGKHSIAF